jgi:Fic family protein
MAHPLDIVDKLAAELRSMQPMRAEYQQTLDKKIRLEFNYNSNHIEGNTLTYGETELLLIFEKTTGNHELREYEEMKSHDLAYEMIREWAADRERPLNEVAVKNLHQVLLVRPFWKEAITADGQPTRRLIEVGAYKKFPNSVRLQNGEIFHYATPENTPMEMGDLMDWYRSEEVGVHPVTLAAMLHYKFVRIHPFDDGNGRLSRLMMNYVLLKNNLPPVVIKSSDKKNYLFALNQADVGDYESFIGYIAEQVIWSLEISIRAAKGLSIDETGDLEKKLHLLKRKLGEDPDASVQYTYGEEAIGKVVHDTLIPLCEAWNEKLIGFDTLLVSRLMRFNAGTTNSSGKQLKGQCKEALTEFLNEKPAKKNIRNLSIQCTTKGLRNIHNGTSINGGQINIQLLHNAYEVSFTNGERFFNKLYHQPLDQKEITTIVEILGNFLFSNIEKFIEASK